MGDEHPRWAENDEVFVWRYMEARAAGLTDSEAHQFAESRRDIEELRRMVRKGCPPALLARIVL